MRTQPYIHAPESRSQSSPCTDTSSKIVPQLNLPPCLHNHDNSICTSLYWISIACLICNQHQRTPRSGMSLVALRESDYDQEYSLGRVSTRLGRCRVHRLHACKMPQQNHFLARWKIHGLYQEREREWERDREKKRKRDRASASVHCSKHIVAAGMKTSGRYMLSDRLFCQQMQ